MVIGSRYISRAVGPFHAIHDLSSLSCGPDRSTREVSRQQNGASAASVWGDEQDPHCLNDVVIGGQSNWVRSEVLRCAAQYSNRRFFALTEVHFVALADVHSSPAIE
jgi:hypothetical protein